MSYLDSKDGMWRKGSSKRYLNMEMLSPGSSRTANRGILYFMLIGVLIVGGYIASFYF